MNKSVRGWGRILTFFPPKWNFWLDTWIYRIGKMISSCVKWKTEKSLINSQPWLWSFVIFSGSGYLPHVVCIMYVWLPRKQSDITEWLSTAAHILRKFFFSISWSQIFSQFIICLLLLFFYRSFLCLCCWIYQSFILWILDSMLNLEDCFHQRMFKLLQNSTHLIH